MRSHAPAFIQVTAVNKATQKQAYTAAARARYQGRYSAAAWVITDGLVQTKKHGLVPTPVDWRAQSRILRDREDTIRKNGQVISSFVISVPLEFARDEEKLKRLARRYARRLSLGRAPVSFAFHPNEKNPHLHGWFADADPETGKRVFGMSDRGSAERCKILWESHANETFAELGIETRISFQMQREAANENEISEALPIEKAPKVDLAPEVSEPSPPLPAEPEVAEIEEDIEEIDAPRVEWAGEHSPAEAARHAAQLADELSSIRALQNERRIIKERYEHADSAYKQAITTSEHALASVIMKEADRTAKREAFVSEHTGLFGRKKGFQISAFGNTYTSPARKAAEIAEQAYHDALAAKELAKAEQERAAQRLVLERQNAETARREYEQIQGNDNDLSVAELAIEAGLVNITADLTPEAIVELALDNEITIEQGIQLLKEFGYADSTHTKELTRGKTRQTEL